MFSASFGGLPQKHWEAKQSSHCKEEDDSQRLWECISSYKPSTIGSSSSDFSAGDVNCVCLLGFIIRIVCMAQIQPFFSGKACLGIICSREKLGLILLNAVKEIISVEGGHVFVHGNAGNEKTWLYIA